MNGKDRETGEEERKNKILRRTEITEEEKITEQNALKGQKRDIIRESKELEAKRIRMATEEINQVLEKYDVQIEGLAIIKATEIRITPKRG